MEGTGVLLLGIILGIAGKEAYKGRRRAPGRAKPRRTVAVSGTSSVKEFAIGKATVGKYRGTVVDTNRGMY